MSAYILSPESQLEGKERLNMREELVLSVEAMGGDAAPEVVIDGLAHFCARQSTIRFIIHGDKARLEPLLVSHPEVSARSEVRHSDSVVRMQDKPSQVLRKSRGSSMWNAIESVKTGEAHAAVSAGNTGALMAISMVILSRMTGVRRPAMAALWPTSDGRSVVLDVGANLDADATQLVTNAIMGEAYARAITGKASPSVGLLNVGTEEMKGHEEIRLAAKMLQDASVDLDYTGFVEGTNLSSGQFDVVVTDGFTGNVALKTAEGTARLVAGYVRDALTSSLMAKFGALLATGGLRQLRDRVNPSKSNGGVLLGLNGVVVKSHGATDAEGFSTALSLAASLAGSSFMKEVANNLESVFGKFDSDEKIDS